MFGLPTTGTYLQTIYNGPDPGILYSTGDETEATLDASGLARSGRAPQLTLWSQNQPRPPPASISPPSTSLITTSRRS